jgi:hypothetical protein
LLATTTSFVFAQDIDKIINATEVERIERILSSDDMQGRRTFSPGIDKAALFIADEFKKQAFNLLMENLTCRNFRWSLQNLLAHQEVLITLHWM